ncbi:DNA-directed RNA polymerase I subunit RPA12 isoform X1 [Physeter macrocephalus]|uniref:DNA-directed RNA polymerase I subunit RPA12 n=1 Tax=Physeter macrocephalus TaxID=9755 RepID=A0A455AI51_PHYMC|nr:DNA-directed RNA polymerase I subunit RPA12 isoform X1 [Physeter catodon]XP_054935552.1 DNA-directed RNA polymerase I subunit RPA12 isoform X1 [Physeter catodon]
MDLASTCSNFQSDLDFCPDCGSVLPLPGAQDTVACTRCGFSINVRDFEAKVVKTSVVFHKLGTAMPVSMEEGPEFQGPVVDRRCSRCGHEGMAYHTRQMRSADEGQTVFYTCTNCNELKLLRYLKGKKKIQKVPGEGRLLIFFLSDSTISPSLPWKVKEIGFLDPLSVS